MTQRLDAVLFDRAGVLVRATQRHARDEWARQHGVDPSALPELVAAAIGPGWQGGRSEEEIARRLVASMPITAADLPELFAALRSDEELDPDMVSLLSDLRPDYRTAVVTNAGPSEREYLCSRYRLDQLVDLIVVSAEEGVAKPDPEIFRRAARRLAVEPRACVFIDDNASYLTGAAEIGMQTIHFIDAATCMRELDELLPDRRGRSRGPSRE